MEQIQFILNNFGDLQKLIQLFFGFNIETKFSVTILNSDDTVINGLHGIAMVTVDKDVGVGEAYECSIHDIKVGFDGNTTLFIDHPFLKQFPNGFKFSVASIPNKKITCLPIFENMIPLLKKVVTSCFQIIHTPSIYSKRIELIVSCLRDSGQINKFILGTPIDYVRSNEKEVTVTLDSIIGQGDSGKIYRIISTGKSVDLIFALKVETPTKERSYDYLLEQNLFNKEMSNENFGSKIFESWGDKKRIYTLQPQYNCDLRSLLKDSPNHLIIEAIKELKKLYLSGYIHGDLLPENILVDEDKVVLHDFIRREHPTGGDAANELRRFLYRGEIDNKPISDKFVLRDQIYQDLIKVNRDTSLNKFAECTIFDDIIKRLSDQ